MEAALSSAFYNELAALDQGIADRWRTATGDSMRVAIDDRKLEAIMSPVLDAGKISGGEAKAIKHLFLKGTFARGTATYLIAMVRAAADNDFFFRGAATPLLTTAELRGVNNALAWDKVGKIEFTSPRSGIMYQAQSYSAIKELIARRKIAVFQVDTGGLNAFTEVGLSSGAYRSNSNHVILYDGLTPVEQVTTIVHEVTHAIQDWQDQTRKLVKFVEADAFIAGAVADRIQGPDQKAFRGVKPFDAAFEAAKLVFEGKGVMTPPSKAWKDAYDKVWQQLAQLPGYKRDANLPSTTTQPAEGSSERTLMTELENSAFTRELDLPTAGP